MASFHFKAIASDGKIRLGKLTAENDKAVALELRKQGLTPVYVGQESAGRFSFRLPSFGGGKRKDVLLFTGELSTSPQRGSTVGPGSLDRQRPH